MAGEAASDIVIRLPRELTGFAERTLYDVGEHIAGSYESAARPPELEQGRQSTSPPSLVGWARA